MKEHLMNAEYILNQFKISANRKPLRGKNLLFLVADRFH